MKMTTTTEIIHAVNFSITDKFVFVNTYSKNQVMNKDGIEAKNANTGMKKKPAPQLIPSEPFRKRK